MMLSLAGHELRLRPMRRFAGHWRYDRSSQAIIARDCDRLVGAGGRCRSSMSVVCVEVTYATCATYAQRWRSPT